MAKMWAMIFGWVFVVLGVLGFFGNPLIGATGYFAADTMHNILNLILGVILLWVSYGAPHQSATALKWVGVALLVLAILGFFIGSGSVLGLVLVNIADNWLHLVLGLVAIWLGVAGSKKAA